MNFLKNISNIDFSTQNISDWDRYASMEYEYLVSEESGDTQG